MIILVSGATGTHKRFWTNPYFGHLVTPRTGNSIRTVLTSGKRWAADNDCFQQLDKGAFLKMLGKIVDQPGCLFVACPDVVADARTTAERFDVWEPVIRAAGLPVALVGQDGAEDVALPWGRFEALFVGGSTEWKLSQSAAGLIGEAKRRGKWVHVGRVNSLKRLRVVFEMGADSIDGTTFSRWADKYFPAALRWIGQLEQQPLLW